MKRYLILFTLLFLLQNAPPCKPLDAYAGKLPRYAIIGQDTDVRGNPRYTSRALYEIQRGKRVRLHDSFMNWVMIAPAEWIPMEDICGN